MEVGGLLLASILEFDRQQSKEIGGPAHLERVHGPMGAKQCPVVDLAGAVLGIGPFLQPGRAHPPTRPWPLDASACPVARRGGDCCLDHTSDRLHEAF